MPSRTFTALLGTLSGAYQLNDKWGFQTAEKVRQALDALAAVGAVYPLGGDERAIVVAVGGTYQDVNAPIELDLDGDNFGGLTIQCIFHSYTSNAATSVTMRLRNVTDSTTAAQGAAQTATSRQREVVTATLASGSKTYRLEITAGNTTNPVYGWAVLRIRKVPA